MYFIQGRVRSGFREFAKGLMRERVTNLVGG